MNTLEAGRNPRDIILESVVTERSSILMDEGKYIFEVDPCASKTEIRIVIEATFGAKVGQVTAQNRRGETHRTHTGQGERKGVKYVVAILRGGAIGIFGDQAWARRDRG